MKYLILISYFIISCSSKFSNKKQNLTDETLSSGNEQIIDSSAKEKQIDFTFSAWVSAPENFDYIEWRDKLKEYKRFGIEEILVKASPEYLSQLMPLADSFEIYVHAWMWTLNQPGNKEASKHPDWYSVNRLGENSMENNPYVGYYQWLSPFHPDARNFIKDKVKSYSEIKGLKSVHLDYVRYVDVILGDALQPKYNLDQNEEMPAFDFGYHPIARDSFKKIFGIDPLDIKYPQLSNEWRQFRLNAVTSLVNEIADIVHEDGKLLSAAVFPFPEMSRKMVRQSWSEWNLDIAYPMVYHNFYNQNINWIGFAIAQGVRESDFPIHAGIYTPALKDSISLNEAIKVAKKNGAEGVCFFTFDLIENILKNKINFNINS